MMRLAGMTDANNNANVVTNVSYNPANQLLTMDVAGYNETRTYNVLGPTHGPQQRQREHHLQLPHGNQRREGWCRLPGDRLEPGLGSTSAGPVV